MKLKGGSYLCAFNYCSNYRPGAVQPQDVTLGASHIGFRTVAELSQEKRPAHLEGEPASRSESRENRSRKSDKR
jgi:hypothetical protein